MITKKTKYFIIPIVVLLLSTIAFFAQPELKIFPSGKTFVCTYSDYRLGGKSIVHTALYGRKNLIFSYTLKDKFQYPYAGCGFCVKEKGEFWDLSSFDYIVIKIKTTRSRALRLFIYTYVDGHTDEKDVMSYAFNLAEIPTWKQQNKYKISLNDFNIPQWWYQTNKLLPDDKESVRDYSKTYSIDIQNGVIVPLEVMDTIVVDEIKFVRSKKPILLFLSVSILLYFIIIIMMYYRRKKVINKVYSKPVSQDGEIANDRSNNEEIKKVTSFIGNNFMNSKLVIRNVSGNCNVSTKEVSTLLKEHYNASFPEYLNLIRVSSAKRLLKTSPMKIIEIAGLTGFGSISHFNRVFKKLEGVTPQSCRDRESDN
ncbi:MAG: AraC family transcriptional regulator [Spirochaetes bacterium]|jgi:AraC-like DNA-binding protein|nr:AraC family transcriptional regulator [Spirochaetota bacterium]